MIHWLSIPIPVPTLPAIALYGAIGYFTMLWLFIDARFSGANESDSPMIICSAYAAIFLTWPLFWVLVIKKKIKQALRRSA